MCYHVNTRVTDVHFRNEFSGLVYDTLIEVSNTLLIVIKHVLLTLESYLIYSGCQYTGNLSIDFQIC